MDKFLLFIGLSAFIFFSGTGLAVYQVRLGNQDLGKKLDLKTVELLRVKGELEALGNIYDRYVEEAKLKFTKVEERISLLEESISPEDFRWAKVKKIREAVDKERHGFKTVIDLTKFSAAVYDYSEEYDVSVPLILGTIKRESNFSPKVVSHAGAKGLMQLMPATAKECAADIGKRYFNIFRVKDNVRLGTWYLGKMMDRFNGDIGLAVRAYNCGPTCVEKVVGGEWSNYPDETIEYVEWVLQYKEKYENMGL